MLRIPARRRFRSFAMHTSARPYAWNTCRQVFSVYPCTSLPQPKVSKPSARRSVQPVHVYLCCSQRPLMRRPARVLSRLLPLAALPFGAPRAPPRHAFSLLTARGAPGGAGFTSPKSFFRVLEFIFDRVPGAGNSFLRVTVAKNVLTPTHWG